MSHRVLKESIPKDRSLIESVGDWVEATWQHFLHRYTASPVDEEQDTKHIAAKAIPKKPIPSSYKSGWTTSIF
jgi:hypothetical protein